MYSNVDSLLNKKQELEIVLKSFKIKPPIILLTEVNYKNKDINYEILFTPKSAIPFFLQSRPQKFLRSFLVCPISLQSTKYCRCSVTAVFPTTVQQKHCTRLFNYFINILQIIILENGIYYAFSLSVVDKTWKKIFQANIIH